MVVRRRCNRHDYAVQGVLRWNLVAKSHKTRVQDLAAPWEHSLPLCCCVLVLSNLARPSLPLPSPPALSVSLSSCLISIHPLRAERVHVVRDNLMVGSCSCSVEDKLHTPWVLGSCCISRVLN